eukprot:329154-Rhodomonas_salina.2
MEVGLRFERVGAAGLSVENGRGFGSRRGSGGGVERGRGGRVQGHTRERRGSGDWVEGVEREVERGSRGRDDGQRQGRGCRWWDSKEGGEIEMRVERARKDRVEGGASKGR